MNKDFVPFELAVKLKKKGFKEKCIAYYWEKINEHTPSFLVEDNMPEDGLNILDLLSNHNQAEWSPFIDAPTISQVLKWLREDKKIVISIFPHPCGWQADIYKDVHQYYDSEAERYLMYYHKEKTEISHSYNWLEIYCIRYVLDNLI